MSVESVETSGTAIRAANAKALVSELISNAPLDDGFDATSILVRHPELATQKDAVVELAHEEYCRRRDAGEQFSHSRFAQRFARFQHSVLRALEVEDVLRVEQWVDGIPDWPEAGDEFLGFSLISELGRGAFSRVFLAHEIDVGNRRVVVKVCDQETDEAARLGRLLHPHIVPIHSVQMAMDTGLTAICMPYLGSATLLDVADAAFNSDAPPPTGTMIQTVARRLGDPRYNDADDKAPDWTASHGTYAEAVIAIGSQLCDALSYTHARGVFHCDIKPSNVLLTSSGHVMLIDFNLSLRVDAAAPRIGGTLPYMAPEQLQRMTDVPADNLPPIQQRTDLFSLGVLMYEMLTGVHPFPPGEANRQREQTVQDAINRQRSRLYSVTKLQEVVGRKLAGVIESCLAVDLQDRPSSAESVAREFRRYLSRRRRCGRWLWNHRVVSGIATIALATTLATATTALVMRPPLHVRELNIGLLSLDEGEPSEATQHFSAALQSNPQSAEALLARGWSRIQSAQELELNDKSRTVLLSQAFNDFNASRDLSDTAEVEASIGYCLCLQNIHQPKSAIAIYQSAIDKGYRTAGVLNNLGYCLREAAPIEAAAILRAAIAVDPKLQAAHRNLAFVEWRLVHADGDSDAVATMNPEQLAAYRSNRETKHFGLAIKHIEIARSCGQGRPYVDLDAARIYAYARHRLGDEHYRDLLLATCKTAIDHGLPPSELGQIAIFWPPLNDDQEFQELLKRDPPVEQVAPSSNLVNLFPEIRSRAFQSE